MSNFIGDIQMSNGLTDVFLNVLVLSGSALAQTVGEKRLTVWLAEHDQSKVGIGAVGFDLSDMPWMLGTFEADKDFLLRVITAAKSRRGWERLEYRPNEDMLFPCLDRFSKLISELDTSAIQPEILEEWFAAAVPSDPVLCGFPLCPKHHTLLTIFGCQICNNGRGTL